MAKEKQNLRAYAGVVQNATQRTPDARIKVNLIDVEAQVRTQFDEQAQAELDASVKAQGVIQPVVLLAKPDGRYRLIAGERRLRSTLNNGIDDIPAVVRRNLEPWEIRRIQVSENAERDDITPHDEARAVSEDVANYGVPQTMEIWNRSEGWVSKRTSVSTYGEPVKQLLKDRVLRDLEVAHSLNQIHDLDKQEFARLEKRVREGLPLSREEARGKVQQVKEWLNEAKQREERRQSLSQQAGGNKGASQAGAGQKTSPKHGTVSERQPDTKSAAAASSIEATTTATSHSTRPAPDAQANLGAKEPAADATGATPAISNEQALVLGQMVTLFQNGLANRELIKDVQDELLELGADMNQTEWAMWSLYQTVALPLLAALGETRAQRYLQRTIADLRTAKPQALWEALHPVTDGKASDDWTAARTPVAPMPKGWRF